MTTPTARKYRTTTRACSCPGFWYRKTCRHYRAYREAVALVLAQEAVNASWDTGQFTIGAKLAPMVIHRGGHIDPPGDS